MLVLPTSCQHCKASSVLLSVRIKSRYRKRERLTFTNTKQDKVEESCDGWYVINHCKRVGEEVTQAANNFRWHGWSGALDIIIFNGSRRDMIDGWQTK